MSRTFKLPRKQAHDWFDRLGHEHGAVLVAETTRTVTLALSDAALEDLISDALYYAEEMDPTNTGDIDYRPPARTLLRALERQNVRYSRRGFTVQLEEAAR